MKNAFLAIILAISIASCATSPDCSRQVAATEIAVTQGYVTVTDLLTTGMIDKAKAKRAMKALDAANAAVDNAGALCRLKDPTASDYLYQAAKAITEFNTITGGK
jgi:hypothetical protein